MNKRDSQKDYDYNMELLERIRNIYTDLRVKDLHHYVVDINKQGFSNLSQYHEFINERLEQNSFFNDGSFYMLFDTTKTMIHSDQIRNICLKNGFEFGNFLIFGKLPNNTILQNKLLIELVDINKTLK